MSNILLTQYQGMFIGPIAKILGYLMEGIFYVLNMIGIQKIRHFIETYHPMVRIQMIRRVTYQED